MRDPATERIIPKTTDRSVFLYRQGEVLPAPTPNTSEGAGQLNEPQLPPRPSESPRGEGVLGGRGRINLQHRLDTIFASLAVGEDASIKIPLPCGLSKTEAGSPTIAFAEVEVNLKKRHDGISIYSAGTTRYPAYVDRNGVLEKLPGVNELSKALIQVDFGSILKIGSWRLRVNDPRSLVADGLTTSPRPQLDSTDAFSMLRELPRPLPNEPFRPSILFTPGANPDSGRAPIVCPVCSTHDSGIELSVGYTAHGSLIGQVGGRTAAGAAGVFVKRWNEESDSPCNEWRYFSNGQSLTLERGDQIWLGRSPATDKIPDITVPFFAEFSPSPIALQGLAVVELPLEGPEWSLAPALLPGAAHDTFAFGTVPPDPTQSRHRAFCINSKTPGTSNVSAIMERDTDNTYPGAWKISVPSFARPITLAAFNPGKVTRTIQPGQSDIAYPHDRVMVETTSGSVETYMTIPKTKESSRVALRATLTMSKELDRVQDSLRRGEDPVSVTIYREAGPQHEITLTFTRRDDRHYTLEVAGKHQLFITPLNGEATTNPKTSSEYVVHVGDKLQIYTAGSPSLPSFPISIPIADDVRARMVSEQGSNALVDRSNAVSYFASIAEPIRPGKARNVTDLDVETIEDVAKRLNVQFGHAWVPSWPGAQVQAISFTRPFVMDGDRIAVLALIKNGSEDRLSVLYGSRSSAVMRQLCARNIDAVSDLFAFPEYDKGGLGESTLTLNAEFQSKFAEVLSRGDAPNTADTEGFKALWRAAVVTNRGVRAVHAFHADHLRNPYVGVKAVSILQPLADGDFADRKCTNALPERVRILPGYEPDFSNMSVKPFTLPKPKTGSLGATGLYGRIDAFTYLSKNKQVEFIIMAARVNNAPLIWIGHVGAHNSPLNSFGLPVQPILAKEILVPGLARPTEIAGMFHGPLVGGHEYLNAAKYTNKLAPIADWKRTPEGILWLLGAQSRV